MSSIIVSSLVPDPLEHLLVGQSRGDNNAIRTTRIAKFELPVTTLLTAPVDLAAFQEGERPGRVALADFVARRFSSSSGSGAQQEGVKLETLDVATTTTTNVSGHRRKQRAATKKKETPFLLERTDIWCSQDGVTVHLYLRVYSSSVENDHIKSDATKLLSQTLSALCCSSELMMNHVAVAVLQDRLRNQLHNELNAVAFVSDSSILPRKSGASALPMASPPAVPFAAPPDSPMNKMVQVEMGQLKRYLQNVPECKSLNGHDPSSSPTSVFLSGLLIPRGVSLIVGGGYHGKSTLLRTISAGVYNKIPGDGREFCVTVDSAVSIRAEDGRHVHNCNVSAFISNLPCAPGCKNPPDTRHFSTGDASGSTSQASNVVEAMEMGASAFLVDEDVSAANFMARDGRMRALVMDESITPLLYRVNGLYASKYQISSIVVVGGVGDWLDVPHQVILMDKYTCKDATAKAQSVSRQFSHGHVQYGGRGVVHRLEWPITGEQNPFPRRPEESIARKLVGDAQDSTMISLLEGSDTIALHPALQEAEDDDEEDYYMDMSRCEQVVGSKKPSLYGCGMGVLWMLQAAQRHPEASLAQLLSMLDKDDNAFLQQINNSGLIETVGFAHRPRRFEVGQALTRLRGMRFEEIPCDPDPTEAAAKVEAERKRKELMELWNARRKNKLHEAIEC